MRSHLVLLERLVVQLREEGVRILQQFLRVVILLQRSALQDKDTIRIDDSVKSVGDGDDRAVLECLIHGLVDDGLSPHVDVGSCLIHEDNFSRLENGSSNADQLTLADRQVLSVLGDLSLETLSLVESLIEGA